jgi:hypothetical protein
MSLRVRDALSSRGSSLAVVRIDFEVDGTAGAFERSSTTGRAELRVGDESMTLESPWSPSTHFGLSTTKTWTVRMSGHDVVVVKRRPQVFGGLREASFTVTIDGHEVATRRGR